MVIGKTAQLALAGADVTALDHSGSRIKRLTANLDRLRLPAVSLWIAAAVYAAATVAIAAQAVMGLPVVG